MFLIRSAFVVAVVIMLLPTDETQQARISGSAGAAAERAATFCERNAATCAAGTELWATFVKKAEFGARLAGSMVQDYMKGDGRARPASVEAVRSAPLDPSHRPQPARGTLTPGDIAPAWRGPVSRTGT
jgi:Family of unknown function (DUF5330)